MSQAEQNATAKYRSRLVLSESDSGTASDLIEAAARIGIRTTWCRDGAQTLLAVGADQPSLLVIAAQTATLDAARVSAAVRSNFDLPILVGAGPGEEQIARQALAAGASAVIVRPYAIAAIAAFISDTADGDDDTVFTAGPIRVDRRRYETRVRGRDVQLTQRELDLLVYLIERRGQVASQEEISRAVWGHTSDTNTVAVHVRRLREKLGPDPEHGLFIRTIRGVGYRLTSSVCA